MSAVVQDFLKTRLIGQGIDYFTDPFKVKHILENNSSKSASLSENFLKNNTIGKKTLATYKSKTKYKSYFPPGPVTQEKFVDVMRYLYLEKNLSITYINSIMTHLWTDFRRDGRIFGPVPSFRHVWSNIKFEKRLYEKQEDRIEDKSAVEKFHFLNDEQVDADVHMTDDNVNILLTECEEQLTTTQDNIEKQLFLILVLAIGTGARVVRSLLTLTDLDLRKLLVSGHVVCIGKHKKNTNIYFIDRLRNRFGPVMAAYVNDTTASHTFDLTSRFIFSITERQLRYRYARLIQRLFEGRCLIKGRVFHDFRYWFIGNVYDKYGIRAAAACVSHRNFKTTRNYVRKSMFNYTVPDKIDATFERLLT